MMVTVSAVIPLTDPLAVPIVATPMLLLLHTPPALASVITVVDPTHTAAAPLMFAGSGSILIAFVADAAPQPFTCV